MSSIPGLGLAVVDIQGKLASLIEERQPFLRRAELALALARLIDIPVVFTEQVPEKLGPTVATLRPQKGEVVLSKTSFSTAGAAGWSEWIAERDISHLLVAGIETTVCVYQTVVQALRSDLDVTILTDAVGARRPDDAAVCLRALEGAGAHLLPVETVFFSILGDAEDDRFREFSRLIKAAAD